MAALGDMVESREPDLETHLPGLRVEKKGSLLRFRVL
jgi:hypothetical protein